jgi:hypothetical protein
MAPRAFGALLALVAALLFMASLAGAIAPTKVPAWWDGHPTVNGKTFEHKAIHVGLLGATGCNLGENVTCDPLETGALLQPIGIAELAALGILTLTTFALLVSIWRIGERRKGLGRVVVVEVLIAAAIAGAWFAVGPEIKAGTAMVSVPIGFGMYAFGGGAAGALIAGLLARIVEREPLRLKTSKRMPAPPPPLEPLTAFDVRELAQAPRPSQPAIPPTPAYSAIPTPLPGPLPAPAGTGPHAPIGHRPAMPNTGPHAPINPHIAPPPPPPQQPAQPLFDHAPQLRPLYDMANVGVVPAPPPPKLPERPPTPVPRASLAETSEFPKSTPKPPPPAATPPARTKAASLPPMRQVAPPSRQGNAAPERPVSKQPTIAHAIPPMPSMVPARAETDPEPSTAVEIDAEAKAKWQAAQARKTPAPTSPPPPAHAATDTDQNPVASDLTDPVEIRPTAAYTAETRADLADTGALPPELAATHIAAPLALGDLATRATEAHDSVGDAPRGSATDVMDAIEPAVTASAPVLGPPGPAATPAVTVDKADFDRTLERNPPPPSRPSAPSLKLQPISVPKTIAPKPIPNVLAPSSSSQRPAPTTPPPMSAEPSKPTTVPLSTAPASLPPPKQAQTAVSGPSPACPQCEAPMAWVEEHLRFYCKQCRMYF